MDDTLTFEIEKTVSYQCVTVTKNENTPENGFVKCTHTPSDGYTNLKSCVKYKNCQLMTTSNSKPIESIQGKIYDRITVFLCKNKKNEKPYENEGRVESCLPLFLELNKKDSPNKPEYYVYKNDESEKSYWVELTGWLKEILAQIGLGISSLQYGFEKLKTLLKKAGVQIESGKKDLTEKLTSIKPEQLKELLQQQISGFETKRTLLETILSKIKFDVTDSVVILLDKKGGENYDDSEVKKITNTKDKSTIKNQNTIVCNDQEEEEDYESGEDYTYGTKDPIPKYKCCTHTIKTNDGEEGKQNNNGIEINFFLCNMRVETYNEYGTEIEYVFYNNENNEVRVFFYDLDPRPLLFCYNNQVYRPKDLANYYTSWIRAKKIKSLQFTNIEENNDLMDILSEVLYIMNPVKLEIHTNNTEEAKYFTHMFYNSKKTKIGIDIMGSDMNAYKDYTHEPGMPGYVLGEISHNGSRLFSNYQNYKNNVRREHKNEFPDSVSVYYYMFDFDYKYPLMVMLHYVHTETNDYYKLISHNPSKWIKIQNTSGGAQDQNDKNFLDNMERIEREIERLIKKLEEYEQSESNKHLQTTIQKEQEIKHNESNVILERKLDEIRKNLNIIYTESSDHLIIKYPQIAKEQNYTIPVSLALLTLSIIIIFIGIVYYRYSKKVLSLYRQLF